MKVPVSYKHSIFGPFLALSFMTHAVVLGVGTYIHLSPKFAVERAPSSLEVIILKEPKVRPKPEIEEKTILTALDSRLESASVPKKQKPRLPREIPRPVIIPPVKGARAEAKPDYLKNPAPVYPRFARDQGWQGLVILKVHVTSRGEVEQVLVDKTSGYKILDEAAVKAVLQWRFQSARIGNLSLASWVRIPIRFILTEK
jgi:protein TonB